MFLASYVDLNRLVNVPTEPREQFIEREFEHIRNNLGDLEDASVFI